MSLSTFSVRDIVATPDDADVLQASLEELHRHRRVKRQEEQARKRCEQHQLLDEDAGSWGTAQELAYRREVLHTWTRQYPRLREAMVSLASASSSNTAATAPAATTAAAFSVAETVRPSYPTLWRIPAGTIPTDFYTHNAAMEVSQLPSTPQRQHATTEAVKDYSAHSCLVRVRWEPVRVTGLFTEPPPSAASSFVPLSQHPCGSTSHAQLQPQRVLARWPQGKQASAKMAAVLRSIGIEERKREQWNEHLLRQRQKQGEREAPQQRLHDRVRDRLSAAPVKVFDNLASSADGCEPATEEGAVDESYSAATAVRAGGVVEDGGSGGGSAADASESALGHELYWPAHITRTRALFTGAACLQDTFHGLGQLQRYERFEPVLALALASSLRIVVDVVYTVDETSEAFGLSIDPVVHFDAMTSSDARRNVATGRDSDTVRSISLGSGCGSGASRHGIAAARRATLSPFEISSSMAEDECPVLLPSSLPPVLSDLNYAFTAAPTAAGAAAGGGSADSRRAASQTTSSIDDSTTTSTAALRRSTLSTSPLSLYTILAGPASQTHSIVLLRPTPEVVCAARARALQELEQRWLRLREALVDRLVACEEQAPAAILARSPTLSPADVLAVELPDADTYASPFIDRSARQGEGLPAEPAGAESLTEEEMQRQTRLPQLQGGHLPRRPLTDQVGGPHGVNGRLVRLSAASPQTPPADPGLRTRSLPSSVRRPSRGSGAQDDGASAEAAAPWSVSTPPTSSCRPQQSPCTPRQSHTRRADQGAWSTDEAASASAGGDDGCGGLVRGSERASTAAAPRSDAGIPRTPQLARSPVDPLSLCSPASCEGPEVPCTNGSSSDLDGLRSALFSEGRRAATEKSRTILAAVRTSKEWPRVGESTAGASQPPATMPRAHLSALAVEASLPVSADAWRLANDTDRVGSAAAPGSPRKASPSSTSLSSQRHRHNDGSPMDADTAMQLTHDDRDAVGDSPRHRTCSGVERYSAILSVSAQSVPDSQPMSALREVSVASCLSWDVRNTMNDTASQHSNTGDGDGQVAPCSGGSGVALPISPSPQLCTPIPTYLPLPSRLNKDGALKMPNLSTPDIAVTLATPCSTVSSPTSPPPHAASPMLQTNFFTAAAAPPHAEDHSQSPSRVRYPILQQPPAPLCHADTASARSSTTNTAAQLSATQPPVAPAEPPLQCSRAASSSSSSSDAARSVLTHTSRPGEKALGGCTKNEKTLSAVPARSDPRTEARSAPQATRSTALESSSSSDDAPVLSGTATYSSYIPVDPLSSVAVAQGASAAWRAGAAALSSPQTPHAAARELRGASASTPNTRPFSSPTFLSDKRLLQLRNLEQPQREPMRRVSPPPPSSLSTSAEARARVHPALSSLRENDDVAALCTDLHHTHGAAPGTVPRKIAVVVEVGPQQRPRLSERGSAGATRHDSARHREHASPLQSGTDAVEATTTSANHQIGHGGSSGTSGAVESNGSPLPRRPPPLGSSPATGVNGGAHEAALMSTAPCAVTPQPPSQHTDGTGATGLASGEPRPSHCPQASASSRMHHRRASPRAPKTAAGSVSVGVLCSELSVSVDREVELPEQPVRLPEMPTPRSPQRSQPHQQPYLVTVNAAAAKCVRSGEPATGLHNLDKLMHSGRVGLPEAHQWTTHALQSRKVSADVCSPYQQAYPHRRSPGEAAREDSPSSTSSAPSASSPPLPLPKSRRPAQRPSRHVGSAGSEKSDAVAPRALSTSCMRHTAPTAAAASANSAPSSVNFSSLMSSAAPSPRGTSPVPHPSGRSSRSGCGSAGELLVLRPHRSTSSPQHDRRYHDGAVALSLSPLSTTRRHTVLVRRVVRRRRSEVFVEEGGTLVHRTPMATPHLLSSSSSSGGSGRGASAPTLPSSPRDTRAARARKTPRRHSHT